MLISRSIISWFAELGESSNQSNSRASIPRTIHQCHHCTGALSSSTSSISSSSLSSSNHHHCHHRRHHHQWHSGRRWANGVFDLGAKFARNFFAQEPSVQQVIKCSCYYQYRGEAGIKWQPKYFSWWQLLWCTVGKTWRVRAILLKPSQSRPEVVPE